MPLPTISLAERFALQLLWETYDRLRREHIRRMRTHAIEYGELTGDTRREGRLIVAQQLRLTELYTLRFCPPKEPPPPQP